MTSQQIHSDYPPAITLARIVSEGSRNKIVFLAFMTQTCPGCKETYEALRKFSREQEGFVEIVVVDADRHPPLITHYGVRGVPTIHVYGQQRSLLIEIGPRSVRMLTKMFKQAQKMIAS
ncbi:MAG: thioredoxin family protein [Magnetococcales bacterium]|nr:thioredoxin family protein [Magnetococcales bacterium]